MYIFTIKYYVKIDLTIKDRYFSHIGSAICNWVFVKGGKFNFGSNIGLEREKPEREVIIQSFLIDKNQCLERYHHMFVYFCLQISN